MAFADGEKEGSAPVTADETIETPILIVGAGAAGMMAAYEVGKAGVKALVISNSPSASATNGAVVSGTCAVETSYTEEIGQTYSLDDLYKRMNKEMVSLQELTEKYDIAELKEILENYVKEEDENKKAAELTRLAKRCSDILKIFDSEISKAGEKGPFDIAVMLEEMKEKIEESLAQIEDKFKSKIDAKADNFQIT